MLYRKDFACSNVEQTAAAETMIIYNGTHLKTSIVCCTLRIALTEIDLFVMLKPK